MDRAGIAIGIVAILVGLAIGSLMIASPQNINPAYPIWIAFLAPLACVFGGLLVCAHALGRPIFIPIMFIGLALCLLVVVNWAAFFTSHIQCRETLSFLGLAILERYPSEVECRASLRIVMACLDAAVLVPVAVLGWRKLIRRDRESTQ